jgi:hypothetical protein
MKWRTAHDSLRPTLHRDGTVTYWSVYREVWIYHDDAVPDRELAAMNEAERTRVRQHLMRHRQEDRA